MMVAAKNIIQMRIIARKYSLYTYKIQKKIIYFHEKITSYLITNIQCSLTQTLFQKAVFVVLLIITQIVEYQFFIAIIDVTYL